MTAVVDLEDELMEACMNNIKGIKNLLERGADPNKKTSDDTGLTALMMAIACNTSPCPYKYIKLLLKKGADPNKKNSEGDTPISAVITWTSPDSPPSDPKLIKLLIKYGADPNILICGKSPLYLAIQKRNIQMIKYLLEGGANLEN